MSQEEWVRVRKTDWDTIVEAVLHFSEEVDMDTIEETLVLMEDAWDIVRTYL
jgi:hypothetical protein